MKTWQLEDMSGDSSGVFLRIDPEMGIICSTEDQFFTGRLSPQEALEIAREILIAFSDPTPTEKMKISTKPEGEDYPSPLV